MSSDANWTVLPDRDADQVVPATYRNMAPWDSKFARGTEAAASGDSSVDAGEATADTWIAGSLMGVYND
jgi:hypothetical protein